MPKHLRALPSLSKLRFSGDPHRCAALLRVPGSAPVLQELVIRYSKYKDITSSVLDDFIAKLESASAVTCVKWVYWWTGGELEDTLLPLALARWPQLVSLEVTSFDMLSNICLRNILRLTGIQRLSLRCTVCSQVVPHLASFPNLKNIAGVSFEEKDVVHTIATITQLTRVEAYCGAGIATPDSSIFGIP